MDDYERQRTESLSLNWVMLGLKCCDPLDQPLHDLLPKSPQLGDFDKLLTGVILVVLKVQLFRKEGRNWVMLGLKSQSF
ncbi:unnamed protein product [Arctogadus glacialis]